MGRRSRLRVEEQSNSGDDSDYVQEYRPRKRAKAGSSNSDRKGKRAQPDVSESLEQDIDGTQPRHPRSVHELQDVHDIRAALLTWFDGVHDAREMPWRKRFNPDLSPEERNQRAYEVWVSEVMLQQTQVITVVPYYNRWMQKFPTIDKLAASNIEQVNALWKGLGYYSRASRLLMGAQKIVNKMGGRIPDNANNLQTNVPGIGRYSAGAICSIAYGERVPVLDGNVHRLLSRLLAIHAPPKAKATLDLMWEAATRLVEMEDKLCSGEPEAEENSAPNMAHTQYPGDINQALIELGSTICKVRDPRCDVCPLRNWCCAYKVANNGTDDKRLTDVRDVEDLCTLCEPVLSEYAVTAYPMKGNRKKAREELDIVNVIEWRLSSAPEERWFLLVRRPENGLLAGLYEFPTTANVPKTISSAALLRQTNQWLSKIFGAEVQAFNPHRQNNGPSSQGTCRVETIVTVGDVVHVFSHIKKIYRVRWVVLEGGQGCPELATGLNTKNAEYDPDANFTKYSMWCQLDEVSGANIGSGVVKVWNLVKKNWEDHTRTE